MTGTVTAPHRSEGVYTVSDAATGRTLHFGGGHAGAAKGNAAPSARTGARAPGERPPVAE